MCFYLVVSKNTSKLANINNNHGHFIFYIKCYLKLKLKAMNLKTRNYINSFIEIKVDEIE